MYVCICSVCACVVCVVCSCVVMEVIILTFIGREEEGEWLQFCMAPRQQ